jgi:hypothetical protein
MKCRPLSVQAGDAMQVKLGDPDARDLPVAYAVMQIGNGQLIEFEFRVPMRS